MRDLIVSWLYQSGGPLSHQGHPGNQESEGPACLGPVIRGLSFHKLILSSSVLRITVSKLQWMLEGGGG